MKDHGVNEAAEDLKQKNQRYTYQSKVNDEAEERKHGGRAKKHRSAHKHGGGTKHRMEAAEHHEHHAHGGHAKHHAGRKPRKSGGRATSDANPFTSARHGTAPKGRKLDMEME